MSTARFVMIIGVAITAIVTTNHAPALVQEAAPAADSGVFRVKSAYDMDETLVRIKKDIVAKGVRFFDEIAQAQLAASAGIKPALCRLGSGLDSETLAVFVGVLFVTTGISRATGALSQYRCKGV